MEKKSKYNVGGEAVIEGVMMRSPHYYAVAVRRADKKIVVTSGEVNSISEKQKFWKWAILRGLLSMWESMSLGFKALAYSADIFEKDLEKEEQKESKKKKTAPVKPRNEALELTISFTIAIAMAILLFIALPYGINRLLAKKFTELNSNRYLFNIGMVFFKLVIFFLYVWAISFMEDIKRLFQYHGSEHKCIYAYEDGKPLTFANTRGYSTRHPRCGTAFIIITLIISIFVFIIFLPPQFNLLQRILWEIPLLIPIIGLSYEALKLSHKYRDNPFIKILIAPGLAFQRLTTKEPDKYQVEVAIKSLKTVTALEDKYIKAHARKVKR